MSERPFHQLQQHVLVCRPSLGSCCLDSNPLVSLALTTSGLFESMKPPPWAPRAKWTRWDPSWVDGGDDVCWLQQHVLASLPNCRGWCLAFWPTCFSSSHHFWTVSISQNDTMTTKLHINLTGSFFDGSGRGFLSVATGCHGLSSWIGWLVSCFLAVSFSSTHHFWTVLVCEIATMTTKLCATRRKLDGAFL